MTFRIILLAAWICTSAQAATIAVIDSGTDLRHTDLIKKAWVNPDEIDDAIDNDNNGYVDDLHGWNIAENNKKLVDYSYLDSFSRDVYTFFDVQLRLLTQRGTEADKKWMEAHRNDAEFLQELQKFGNFVHGTHVAGIAAKDSDLAKILVLKIIPTEVKLPFMKIIEELQSKPRLQEDGIKDILIRMGLTLLAQQQGKGLKPVTDYLAAKKPSVANCSFGTGTKEFSVILEELLKQILQRDPTPEEVEEYAVFFINEVLKSSSNFVTDAPNTLFVVAAGNSASDNDKLPTFPANVRAENKISVAALFSDLTLASFSNYGVETVDIAAPGVGILSAIPGQEYLHLSGTSQASPFVANIAGKIIDTNPKLRPADVKLILMGTVDFKAELKNKVKSGGVANEQRALLAAYFSQTKSLDLSVSMARSRVPDQPVGEKLISEKDVFILPMPALFK